MYERDGWKRTDTYSFTAPCETPTTYAIEAVDSEGVAAVIANFVHCGEGTHTDENWRCAATTRATISDHGGGHLGGSTCDSSRVGEHSLDENQNLGNQQGSSMNSQGSGCSSPRSFMVVDQRMSYADGRDYCRLHYDDLASLHSAEDQQLAKQKCQAELGDTREVTPTAVLHTQCALLRSKYTGFTPCSCCAVGIIAQGCPNCRHFDKHSN
jgi:hypothetical protein